MARQKFEVQDFYDVTDTAVLDSRVTSLLMQLAVAPTPVARRWDIPYVHTIQPVDSAGTDGEVSSGAVGVADIQTVAGTKMAAIHSGLFSHDTGLPEYDCSWSVEFDDPMIAREFWKRHWKPNFTGQDVFESLRTYIRTKPDLTRGSIRYQTLGLLYPWYLQRAGDHALLDTFATHGNDSVSVPEQHKANSTLTTGQVYKVPECDLWTTRIHNWAVKTCLAAFTVKPSYNTIYNRNLPASTVVQWADGTLESYMHSPTVPVPQPLIAKDLRVATNSSIA